MITKTASPTWPSPDRCPPLLLLPGCLSRPDLDRRKSLISLEGLKTVTKNEIIEQAVGEEQAQTMTTKIVSGELSQEVLK